MSSEREAEAAKELLLTRLMGVHPEVYGGGRIIPDLQGELGWLIEIDLTKPFPDYVKPAHEFMGWHVVYRVTGWGAGIGFPRQDG